MTLGQRDVVERFEARLRRKIEAVLVDIDTDETIAYRWMTEGERNKANAVLPDKYAWLDSKWFS